MTRDLDINPDWAREAIDDLVKAAKAFFGGPDEAYNGPDNKLYYWKGVASHVLKDEERLTLLRYIQDCLEIYVKDSRFPEDLYVVDWEEMTIPAEEVRTGDVMSLGGVLVTVCETEEVVGDAFPICVELSIQTPRDKEQRIWSSHCFRKGQTLIVYREVSE